MAAAVALMALPASACEGLLEVELPGSLTEDALKDPALSETLVTSAVTEFDCGFVDYMRYPGQWFEEWQNSSQSRPDALSQFRSALVGVYADPCASGTGPIWTIFQVPRSSAAKAIDFIRYFGANGLYTASTLPDTTFLIAKARLYEAYSVQLLAEHFCAITMTAPSVLDPPASGGLVTREAAYDSAEAKFTEAINYATLVTGARATEAAAVRNAARVGRARARLYQWQYSGGAAADVIADASAVSNTFQMLVTYDDNPTRRRNRIFTSNNQGKTLMPYADYTHLRLNADGTHAQGAGIGVADTRVVVNIAANQATDPDGRGVGPARRQGKFANRAADIPFSTWREAQLMIAEVDLAQARTIINTLRTTAPATGAGWTLPAGGLPQIAQATWDAMTPAQQRTFVWEERRRELWMQGTHAGDKIRWAYPAWDSADEYGGALRDVATIDDPLTIASNSANGGDDPNGCLPIPYLERQSNTALLQILGS
jgi:hypothetical protein